MPFVVDASIVLDWALEEHQPTADAARERLRTDAALSPSLLWFEVRNGLLTAERNGRSNADHSASFLRELARLPVTIEPLADAPDVMSLARRHRLTVYDAAYLELAQRRGVPLATLDSDLTGAAAAEGTTLIGPE
jgi:predicted nucleic acid-binding protein